MIFDYNYFLYLIAAYLLGSISSAIIVCRLMSIKDPRLTGSRNPGATNVLRHGGKIAAIITLTGDVLKGLIAILIVQKITQDPLAIGVTGAGVFLGHLYPVYFKFKGGKGLATFMGIIIASHWLAGLLAVLAWVLTAVLTKISSLSGLISAIVATVTVWYFTDSSTIGITSSMMTALLFWRHRTNILSLYQGVEPKIGTTKSEHDETV